MSRYDIHEGNLLRWAETYEGAPFHALLCDPPYHLTEIVKRFGSETAAPPQGDVYARSARGFMGKQWDGGDVAFRPETWAALAEHLHPGAYGMAFASTRGYHRMACAIEDAGLIIHTMLGWAFGCLSEDTEILTADGWEPYHKAIANTAVLCYNMASESLEWHRVQELMVYEYNETAYHIRSQNTDQIVSRNHRCIVERSGRWVFEYAERLGCVEHIPVLSEAAIQAAQSLPRREAHRESACLSHLRYGVLQAARVDQKGARRADMWQRLSGRGPLAQSRDPRPSQADRWARARGLDSREPRIVSAEHERRAQPRVEGRRDLLQEARQLHRREVRALSGGVPQHGAQGWVRDGASADGRTGDRPAAAALRSGTPQGSQSREQRAGQSATVRHEQGSQALRAPWGARPDLATVTPVHYRGKVWCVRVPTGAFVARRNGHIFITGNSGFPKATRIDVQLDRRAGAERPVVGERKHAPKFDAKRHGYREKDNGFNSRDRQSFAVTASATDLARTWEGYRYGGQAIKPAFEPIVVFQRPYEGKPVDCIARTGAGALNVDGGRVPGTPWQAHHAPGLASVKFFTEGETPVIYKEPHDAGRWPANLLLAHEPECGAACVPGCAVRRLGEQSGVSEAAPPGSVFRRTTAKEHSYAPSVYGAESRAADTPLTTHGDTGTAARFFYNADWMLDRLDAADPVRYVAKASTAEREAGLDGWEPTTVDDGRAKSIDNPYLRGETQRRNTHPTIKPIDLCRYLATLLLPPAAYGPRRLLVPFSGSGSEMIGAGIAGWEFVQGIELEADHVAIARARLGWWVDVFGGERDAAA